MREKHYCLADKPWLKLTSEHAVYPLGHGTIFPLDQFLRAITHVPNGASIFHRIEPWTLLQEALPYYETTTRRDTWTPGRDVEIRILVHCFLNARFSVLTCSLFVWLWLVVNDRKFPVGTVFFSHTNQPAVFLHEPATIRTSQPNRRFVSRF